MEEVQESKRGLSKWKTIFIIAFTIVAVGGMMYMLFTDEEYNKYSTGSSSSSSDSGSQSKSDTTSSYTASTSSPEAQNSSYSTTTAAQSSGTDASSSANKQETTPPVTTTPEPVKAVAETRPPVVEKKVEPSVKTPPVTKIVAKAEPKPVPVVVKPQPPVVVKHEAKAPNKVTPAAPSSGTATSSNAKAPKHAAKAVAKEDKVMSDGELQDLANSIIEKGKAAGVYPKCVQLRSTTDGNNKSTMQQIELYLRQKNFTIAGRQTVSGHVSGYQVTPGDGCMKLVVGSF